MATARPDPTRLAGSNPGGLRRCPDTETDLAIQAKRIRRLPGIETNLIAQLRRKDSRARAPTAVGVPHALLLGLMASAAAPGKRPRPRDGASTPTQRPVGRRGATMCVMTGDA